MSTEEKTDPHGPFALFVRPHLDAMEARLKEHQDANADRIVRSIASAMQRLNRVEASQKAWEQRVLELERKVANLEERFDGHAGDTEPPPPSGLQQQ